jgi:rSAM/selenodomain-associated transferase 1
MDLDEKLNSVEDFDTWYAVSPQKFNDDVLAPFIQMDKYFLQEGHDLGERMNNAFIELFSRGYDNIVLIGSDIPSITRDMINQALKGLQNNDCVIGPSKDGGYYLIALSQALPYIFEDIPWSTSKVFEKSIKILNKKGFTYKLIQELEDIDTYKELVSFYEHLRDKPVDNPDFPSHSWKVLQKIFTK